MKDRFDSITIPDATRPLTFRDLLFGPDAPRIAFESPRELLRLIGGTTLNLLFRKGVLVPSKDQAKEIERLATSGPEYDFVGTTPEQLFKDLEGLMSGTAHGASSVGQQTDVPTWPRIPPQPDYPTLPDQSQATTLR